MVNNQTKGSTKAAPQSECCFYFLGRLLLPVSPHYQCTEQADDCEWDKHDVVSCYCKVHGETTKHETTKRAANGAKCCELHKLYVFKMKRQGREQGALLQPCW